MWLMPFTGQARSAQVMVPVSTCTRRAGARHPCTDCSLGQIAIQEQHTALAWLERQRRGWDVGQIAGARMKSFVTSTARLCATFRAGVNRQGPQVFNTRGRRTSSRVSWGNTRTATTGHRASTYDSPHGLWHCFSGASGSSDGSPLNLYRAQWTPGVSHSQQGPGHLRRRRYLPRKRADPVWTWNRLLSKIHSTWP